MSDMTSWHSYPKVWNLGHAAVKDILADDVVVEEKVDGSQFSFGRFVTDEGVQLRCRSKGAQLHVDAPDQMFRAGVATAHELFPLLRDGWTYRGEYLAKPKHNALAYDRIPARHVILFDINTAQETYLSWEEKAAEAARLGLEVMPRVHQGRVETLDFFRSLLDRTSVLGGQKVEGVVVKNYAKFGPDGKALLGKFVSEAFKEVHGREWKEMQPGQGDIVERIIDKLRTPARWAKAVQHMAEAGKLEHSPRDIGKLIRETQADILAECEGEIREALFQWAKGDITRGVIRGLPEWYKGELLKRQFSGDGGGK